MININELRTVIQEIGLNGVCLAELVEILDRLEAAEKDITLKERIIDSLGSELNAVAKERDALRTELADLRSSMTFRTSLIGRIEAERDALQAKVNEMERQDPIGKIHINSITGNPSVHFIPGHRYLHHNDHLYALPGAQPAPSIPEGWLRAIDEALVIAHIGVVNESDTYEQAKAKLDNLIGFHVDVATDPAVNGGWKLVPIETTPSVPDDFVWPECPKRRQSHVLFDDGYEEGWAACVATVKAMINTALETKP